MIIAGMTSVTALRIILFLGFMTYLRLMISYLTIQIIVRRSHCKTRYCRN